MPGSAPFLIIDPALPPLHPPAVQAAIPLGTATSATLPAAVAASPATEPAAAGAGAAAAATAAVAVAQRQGTAGEAVAGVPSQQAVVTACGVSGHPTPRGQVGIPFLPLLQVDGLSRARQNGSSHDDWTQDNLTW